MISYVKLKNFISFGEVMFDFKKNANSIKNFAAIYGENGSGKTNFVKSIELLRKSMITLDLFTSLPSFMDEISSVVKDIKKEYKAGMDETSRFLLRPILNYLSDCRMRDCSEPTEVEYGFRYKERNGIYRFAFKESIIEESLYYWTGKQSGYLFRLSLKENGTIVSKIDKMLADSDLKSEMNKSIGRFWGKHSLLSIITYQLSGQNHNFTKEKYSSFLLDVLDCFSKVYVSANNFDFISQFDITCFANLLSNLNSGKVDKDNLPTLKRTELFVGDVLTQSYADIKGVEYKIEPVEDEFLYRLIIHKMIAGKIREIPVSEESEGTRRLLKNLVPFVNAMEGNIVFLDEADTGIHDVLFNNILKMVCEKLMGQLVITTHNTTLLESIEPKSAYFITVDYNGNKEAVCMSEYGVQKSNNPREMYLKGLFGGVPVLDTIDSDSIVTDLNTADSDLAIDLDMRINGRRRSAPDKKGGA